jgi:hypothetical protein
MHNFENIKRCPCRPDYQSYTSARAGAYTPGVKIHRLQHNAVLHHSVNTEYTQK